MKCTCAKLLLLALGLPTLTHLAAAQPGTVAEGFVTTEDHHDDEAGQKEKDAEKELIQLEKQWAEAEVKGDTGFFERIAAADYVIVDCDGSVRNKQQEIVNSRQEAPTSSTVEDMKVRVFARSAVVVGAFTIAGTYAGQPNNLSGNFTDVWIRPNRTWQLASTQNTCKPAEAAQDQNPPDSFFIAKEKEVWEAIKHKDKAAATRLLADDFTGLYDSGFSTKPEWIKEIDDEYTIDDYTIEDAKLLRPSATTALLLYNSRCKGGGESAEQCSHTSRISDLWVERNGQWFDLFSQDTAATSSATLPHDDLSGHSRVEHPTGKDAVETPQRSVSEAESVSFFMEKEKEVWEALKHKDKVAATRLLADNFVGG